MGAKDFSSLSGGASASISDLLALSANSVTAAGVINIGGQAYIDTTGYSSIAIQFNSVGVGATLFFERSDDNVNWFAHPLPNASNAFWGTPSAMGYGNNNTLSGTGIYEGPVISRYFRVRIGAITSGTVTAQATLRKTPYTAKWSATQGSTAPGSSISSSANPLIAGLHARTANAPVANGQAINATGTLAGALIIKPYSIPEAEWSYAAASGGIANATAVTVAAAAGSGLRNYITAVQLSSGALGAATELAIRDGASGTVLYRTFITTAGLPNGREIIFPTPLKSSANTLLEVVLLTNPTSGAVYFNAQGYIAS